MKIISARFTRSVPVGSREVTFVNVRKDNCVLEFSNDPEGIKITFKGAITFVPWANVSALMVHEGQAVERAETMKERLEQEQTTPAIVATSFGPPPRRVGRPRKEPE